MVWMVSYVEDCILPDSEQAGHHVESRNRGSNECNGGLGRILPPGVVTVIAVVVVVVAAAIAVVVVVAAAEGGVLPSECGECRKATAAKRALHVRACLNQGCKSDDWLNAEQTPNRWLCTSDDDLNRLLVRGPIANPRG